jgi:glutaredoxin 3
MVKEYLSQKGIPFLDYDVSRDSAAAQEMVNRTGQRGVPVIIIDGQIVVGFDRPQLDRLLSQSAKPAFGASIADATQITGGIAAGAYIGQVRANSIAASLGLNSGDIVIAVNTRTVSNVDDLALLLSRLKHGDHISITYVRNNRPLTAEGTY